MIGVTPVGFRVYAAPGTAHAQSLAATTSAVSSQLRSLGLPVVFMGYGRPTRVEGIITVAEGSAGCTGSAVTMANTFWYARGLTSGEHFMSRADIVVCPKLYLRPAWQQAAIMRHEFGHAMGLGHMNVVYSRAYQVMNATTHTGISNYGAGDLAGLRYIVAGTARVRIALRR
jgi:hypothetical protein